MSTQFTNRQWRLPNNENKDKQSNYSMDFDGSSLIDLGDITMLNGVSQASYSFWFKLASYTPASGSTSVMLVGSNAKGASCYIYLNNFYIHNFNTKFIYFRVPSLNQWHHICCVFNSGVAEAYLDGVSVGTVTEPTLTTTASDFGNNFNIGYSSFYSAYMNANGKIDGLSFFNYALSSSQITTLYGSSSTGIGNPMSLSPKPVAYYPLGDQDAFNGSSYLTPNASLKDFVFNFDSSSSNYIDFNSINLGTTNTISFWHKRGATSNQYVLGSTDGTQKYIVYFTPNYIYIRPDGSTQFITTYLGNTPYPFPPYNNTTDWANYIITRSGDNIKLYLNGVEFALSGSGSGMAATTVNRIGTKGTSVSNTIDGELSNIQFFNTALPATGSNSVETLYNNGSPLTSMTGFTSLQGWWKLDASDTYDSSTGNWTIEDHAGSNDGTSSGMTQANLVQSDLSFTSGYSPYALDFDAASSDYIDCGNVPELNGVTQISFSIWFNNQTPSNNKGLIGDMQAINFSPALGRFHLIVRNVSSNDYSFRLYIIGSDSAIHSIDIDNRPFTSNEWYNLVVVYNAGLVNFYVDGSLAPSTITAGAPIPTSFVALTYPPNKPLQIGRWSNLYFDGKISNASIWNTALTSTQVTEIYNEGVPSNLNNHSAYSNLVSWWQLGSNSSFNTNWTVLDEKGSNNGTSANMGEDAIVDGVNTYGGGTSSGMGGDEVIGDAPYSTANALSVNMDVEDRVTDTPS